jgi:putative transposase
VHGKWLRFLVISKPKKEITMAMRVNDSKIAEIIELISEKGFAGMAEVMQILVNEAMRIERSHYLRAEPYERNELREDYANGYKPKQYKTTVGHLSLQIPQVRSGGFYPSMVEKGLRSDRALKLALAEMYVKGVSTRKVNDILQELCGLEISSSEVSRASQLLDEELTHWKSRSLGRYPYVFLDARYEKVREAGCVISCAILIAYGIDAQGRREILGVSVSLSEQEVHWRKFLESLVSRGLHGITLIVSDAHSGLKAALNAVFPSVPWQRCQFHLQQNAQAYVTKTHRKREVADSIRAIFDAENREEALRLLKHTVLR